MSDDLIKRLERWGADAGLQNHFIGSRSARKDCAEAAARIVELEAEVARLREALSLIAVMGFDENDKVARRIGELAVLKARAALGVTSAA